MVWSYFVLQSRLYVFSGGKQYYTNVVFKNMAGQDVVILPSDHSPAEGWKIKKNFMVTVTKGTLSAQSVTLLAFTNDKKRSPLALNGKLEIAVTPHTTKTKKEVIVISKQGEKHAKGFSLSFWCDPNDFFFFSLFCLAPV